MHAASLALWLVMSLMIACHQETADRTGGKEAGPQGAALHITKIRLLLDSRYEPFRSVQMKMFNNLAISRAGVQIETVDCAGSTAVQRQMIEKSSGVDFLLVFPVDLPAITEALGQAKRAGIKVIVFDGEAPPESCSTVIYHDEEKLGHMAGDLVVRSLRKRAGDEGYDSVIGRVVYLQDAGDGAALMHRQEAFLKALSVERGIALVHEAPVNASGTDAAPRLAEAFRLQQKFDVIFCDTDLIAAAASAAVTATNPAARQDMLIVGVDGALGKGGGVDLTIKGQIDATLLRPLLVDTAWTVIEKYLDTPTFVPNPRYEQAPQPVNLETALRLGREDPPLPGAP